MRNHGANDDMHSSSTGDFDISNSGEDPTTGTTAGEEGHRDAEIALSTRPMGQLVLRLSWVEPGEGGGENDEAGGTSGYTTLVVHRASGLAKADL